jgi:hypothetical protein
LVTRWEIAATVALLNTFEYEDDDEYEDDGTPNAKRRTPNAKR